MKRGSHMTEESRAKMTKEKMTRVFSPETRAKLSEATRARWADPETGTEMRAKTSAANTGNTYFLGHAVSPETRAKISAGSMGRIVLPETRAKIGTAHWKGGRVVTSKKDNAKRRALGFTPLNGWFLGCEGHHVDGEQVIHLPKLLHRSVFHRQTDGRGMAQINALAYNFLSKQGMEPAMMEGK